MSPLATAPMIRPGTLCSMKNTPREVDDLVEKGIGLGRGDAQGSKSCNSEDRK
jgi:hypothetical protein